MQETTVKRPLMARPSPLPRERPARTAAELARRTPKLTVEHVNFYYGQKQALSDVSLLIPQNCVTALIGPSGCGKSTFLRCINRMNDLIDGTRVEGQINLEGDDILGPKVDVVELRKRVGMVFQKSNPFPKSIFENVAYGPRVAGIRDKAVLYEIVEKLADAGGTVGRSEGSAGRFGFAAFGRPAAAAVHRAGPGDRTRTCC